LGSQNGIEVGKRVNEGKGLKRERMTGKGRTRGRGWMSEEDDGKRVKKGKGLNEGRG